MSCVVSLGRGPSEATTTLASSRCHLRPDRGISDYMAEFSAMSSVGWIVSPIIRKMVSVVQSYISSQFTWKSEMMSDLKNLESTLRKDEVEKTVVK
uniref:Uncharacterized protein n=1 Tax=Oryza rufipogon TaxID=4529 RepID=A0A0E0Q093_ORYRU